MEGFPSVKERAPTHLMLARVSSGGWNNIRRYLFSPSTFAETLSLFDIQYPDNWNSLERGGCCCCKVWLPSRIRWSMRGWSLSDHFDLESIKQLPTGRDPNTTSKASKNSIVVQIRNCRYQLDWFNEFDLLRREREGRHYENGSSQVAIRLDLW